MAHTLATYVHPVPTPTSISQVTSFLHSSQIVLLGEATHGTHEFYLSRAAITKDLIQNHGFEAVAVEADWPDSYRACQYATGWRKCTDKSAQEALSGFCRFPRWMWANEVVAGFLEWLKGYNALERKGMNKVAFYGLDLYSLSTSQAAVIEYFEKEGDKEGAERARRRYACFDQADKDPQRYGREVSFGVRERGKEGVVKQLVEMLRNTHYKLFLEQEGEIDGEGESSASAFYAEQNARVVKNAEEYYTSMFDATRESWNIRDGHMMETLSRLVDWIQKRDGGQGKIIVWAHNSHLGDCRATQMSQRGQLNLGQLCREKWGNNVKNIGFSTYTGTVMAADKWDAPGRVKKVVSARGDSFEGALDKIGDSFFLPLTKESKGDKEREKRLEEVLGKERLERAIGVIYLPKTERMSHYFYADLRRQFDGVIYFRKTSALKPLKREGYNEAEMSEEPEMEEVLIG